MLTIHLAAMVNDIKFYIIANECHFDNKIFISHKRNIFTEEHVGTVKVTRSKKLIESVVAYFLFKKNLSILLISSCVSFNELFIITIFIVHSMCFQFVQTLI